MQSNRERTHTHEHAQYNEDDIESLLVNEVVNLPDAWTVWYDEFHSRGTGSSQVDYESIIKELGTFSTAQEFYKIWVPLCELDVVPEYSNIRIFRKGIKPMWEDPANINGGKWIIPIIAKPDIQSMWNTVVLGTITEQFVNELDLCGIVITMRAKDHSIQLWTRTVVTDPVKKSVVTSFLYQRLNLPEHMETVFQSHQASSDFSRLFVRRPRSRTKKKATKKLNFDEKSDVFGDESDHSGSNTPVDFPYFIPISTVESPMRASPTPPSSPSPSSSPLMSPALNIFGVGQPLEFGGKSLLKRKPTSPPPSPIFDRLPRRHSSMAEPFSLFSGDIASTVRGTASAGGSPTTTTPLIVQPQQQQQQHQQQQQQQAGTPPQPQIQLQQQALPPSQPLPLPNAIGSHHAAHSGSPLNLAGIHHHYHNHQQGPARPSSAPGSALLQRPSSPLHSHQNQISPSPLSPPRGGFSTSKPHTSPNHSTHIGLLRPASRNSSPSPYRPPSRGQSTSPRDYIQQQQSKRLRPDELFKKVASAVVSRSPVFFKESPNAAKVMISNVIQLILLHPKRKPDTPVFPLSFSTVRLPPNPSPIPPIGSPASAASPAFAASSPATVTVSQHRNASVPTIPASISASSSSMTINTAEIRRSSAPPAPTASSVTTTITTTTTTTAINSTTPITSTTKRPRLTPPLVASHTPTHAQSHPLHQSHQPHNRVSPDDTQHRHSDHPNQVQSQPRRPHSTSPHAQADVTSVAAASPSNPAPTPVAATAAPPVVKAPDEARPVVIKGEPPKTSVTAPIHAVPKPDVPKSADVVAVAVITNDVATSSPTAIARKSPPLAMPVPQRIVPATSSSSSSLPATFGPSEAIGSPSAILRSSVVMVPTPQRASPASVGGVSILRPTPVSPSTTPDLTAREPSVSPPPLSNMKLLSPSPQRPGSSSVSTSPYESPSPSAKSSPLPVPRESPQRESPTSSPSMSVRNPSLISTPTPQRRGSVETLSGAMPPAPVAASKPLILSSSSSAFTNASSMRKSMDVLPSLSDVNAAAAAAAAGKSQPSAATSSEQKSTTTSASSSALDSKTRNNEPSSPLSSSSSPPSSMGPNFANQNGKNNHPLQHQPSTSNTNTNTNNNNSNNPSATHNPVKPRKTVAKSNLKNVQNITATNQPTSNKKKQKSKRLNVNILFDIRVILAISLVILVCIILLFAL